MSLSVAASASWTTSLTEDRDGRKEGRFRGSIGSATTLAPDVLTTSSNRWSTSSLCNRTASVDNPTPNTEAYVAAAAVANALNCVWRKLAPLRQCSSCSLRLPMDVALSVAKASAAIKPCVLPSSSVRSAPTLLLSLLNSRAKRSASVRDARNSSSNFKRVCSSLRANSCSCSNAARDNLSEHCNWIARSSCSFPTALASASAAWAASSCASRE
mmetsp:Transcript_28501/g.64528  ORF Transcript_28501/g.64528 Transcript_28501/m.64528 type:complete len:214 (+) Transcript_28501:407-1048(+)